MIISYLSYIVFSVLHCVFSYSACISLPIPVVYLEPPTHPSVVSIAACTVLDHTHSLLQINWDAASLVVFAAFVLAPRSSDFLATQWTVAYQAPLSMEFHRQEYWNGLPFPSSWDRPDPGIKLHLMNCRQIPYHRATWELLPWCTYLYQEIHLFSLPY